MDKLIKYIISATIAGVILSFNIYHADYKLLVAQVGTIVLVAMYITARFDAGVIARPEGPKQSQGLLRRLRLLAMTVKNPVVWFLTVCVLSFLMSPHKLTSWHELYKVGTWIVFGMIVAAELALQKKLDAKQALRLQIINVWLVCAGIAAVYGILQFFGIDFMKIELPGGRIASTFGNATLLAGFLAMTVPVALAKVLEPKKAISYQLSAISLVVVLLACLVLTKSRGGILVAMVGIGIVLLKGRAEQALRLRPYFFICLLLGAVSLILLPQVRYVVFDVILRKTARTYIWEDALRLVRIHPLLGTGIGTFSLYFPQAVSQGVLNLHPIEWEFVNHAHCEYLEILVEMGIVGLLVFLGVVIYIMCNMSGGKNRDCFVVHLRRTPRNDNSCVIASEAKQSQGIKIGLFAAFVAALVHNVVSVDLRYTSTGLLFWMMAGILSWREK